MKKKKKQIGLSDKKNFPLFSFLFLTLFFSINFSFCFEGSRGVKEGQSGRCIDDIQGNGGKRKGEVGKQNEIKEQQLN